MPRKRTRRKQVRQWLIEFKSKVKCGRCGFSHPAAIQFHHRDPSLKVFEIGEASRLEKSIPQVIEEMAKCEIICANCHMVLHYEERQELAIAVWNEEAEYQELLQEEEL